MKTVAIIPARYASTRFAGKPLACKTGKPLIRHVCEAVAAAPCVSEVIVATDDERIAEAVRAFGGRAEMTRADHPCGTDRIAECAERLGLDDSDIVLNVQGDEPEIDPGHIQTLVDTLTGRSDCRMATLACPFPADGPRTGPGSPVDPNCVKVVLDTDGRALYFSRALIPYPRETGGVVDDPSRWLLHVGIYAFRAAFLAAFASLPRPTGRADLETVECLEQLRVLAWSCSSSSDAGPIAVGLVDRAAVGIDTPEDYAAFVERTGRGPAT